MQCNRQRTNFRKIICNDVMQACWNGALWRKWSGAPTAVRVSVEKGALHYWFSKITAERLYLRFSRSKRVQVIPEREERGPSVKGHRHGVGHRRLFPPRPP